MSAQVKPPTPYTVNSNEVPNCTRSGTHETEWGIVPLTGCVRLAEPKEEKEEMPPKQTYQNNGKPVTGEPVKVEHTSEPWAEYTLADGSKIKAKLVLLEAVRLDDFHPATGDPIYQLQFQNIMGITVPQELKKIVDPNTPGKPVQ